MKYKESLNIKWKKPPKDLANDFFNFEKKVKRTQRVTFNKIKKLLVDDAKRNAPWTDRTGDARRTLHAKYETQIQSASIAIVDVFLIHGVDYGIFLELANSGRFAIIHDTLIRNKDKIMKILEESLSDFK